MTVATFSKPLVRAIYITQRPDGAWVRFAAHRPQEVTLAELQAFEGHPTREGAMRAAKDAKKRTGLPLIQEPVCFNWKRGGSFAPDGGEAA